MRYCRRPSLLFDAGEWRKRKKGGVEGSNRDQFKRKLCEYLQGNSWLPFFPIERDGIPTSDSLLGHNKQANASGSG